MRLFVALDLPWDLKLRLSGLAGGIPGARWVPTENLHLTLRFIGEALPHEAEEIDAALLRLRAPPVELKLGGLGTFEKAGRTTMLWVAAERSAALDHLQAKVDTALQRAGFPGDRKRFAPHVTIARMDGTGAQPAKLAAFVQAHNLFRAEPVVIDHFTLFSSHLSKDDPVYTPEAEYALG